MSHVTPIHPPRRENRLLLIGIGMSIGVLAGLGILALPDKEPQPVDVAPSRVISRSLPACQGARRVVCVVEGDTMWLAGEKIRLDSMNAPEVQGQCDRERELARRATRRLSELLSASAFSIVRNGTDRYGRTLARVTINDRDVGMILVAEGLAHTWSGWKRGWC